MTDQTNQLIEAFTDAENLRTARDRLDTAIGHIEAARNHLAGIESPPPNYADDDDQSHEAARESIADLLGRAETRREMVASLLASYGTEYEGFATDCILYPSADVLGGDYTLEVTERQSGQRFQYGLSVDGDEVVQVVVQNVEREDGSSLDPQGWAVNTALAWDNQVDALRDETGFMLPDEHDAEHILTFPESVK